MMRFIAVALILILLSACGSLGMGKTEYEIIPIETKSGEVVCCKVTILNSKDYENLKFTLKKNVDGSIEVMLDEKGVSASDPASINAQNQSKMLDTIEKLLPIISD